MDARKRMSGRRGIRTHGDPKDLNGFRDRPIRPLWQPSEAEATGETLTTSPGFGSPYLAPSLLDDLVQGVRIRVLAAAPTATDPLGLLVQAAELISGQGVVVPRLYAVLVVVLGTVLFGCRDVN